MAERTVAFVVARLSSSRMPAKHFRSIGGQKLIDWTLQGLREAREIDEIVIATVAEEENLPLRDYAQQQGLRCFWYQGEVDHVTTRLRRAAEQFDAEICLLISGDCPLIYAPVIDDFLRDFKAHPEAEILGYEGVPAGMHSALEGVGIYRRSAWQRGDELSDRPELKEHQFPIFGLRPELFKSYAVELPPSLHSFHGRFSVDTPADLEFMNALHDRLQQLGRPFNSVEVVRLLDEEPQLAELNRHVYRRKLVEQPKTVVLAVDSGGDYGYGHLMRSLELAQQLVERLGWKLIALVDDPRAVELFAACSLRCRWGSLGRETRAGRPESIPLAEEQIKADLALLDLAARPVAEGWRNRFGAETKLLAIDSLAPWTKDADLRILPGVNGPAPLPEGTLGGADYLILRRAVRHQPRREKELDLLVYHRQPEVREAACQLGEELGLKVELVDGSSDDFAQLLARSRMLLSNYGYSFYEALALGTLPLAWPLSARHGEEAAEFYARLALPDLRVEKIEELRRLLQDESLQQLKLPQLTDGTARLVAAAEALCCGAGGSR